MKVIHNEFGFKAMVSLQDGAFISASEQDCTPIVEYTKALLAEAEPSKEMRLAAIIPNVVIETYMNVNGIDYEECMTNPVHFKRMCNDPALADFRTCPGRV